MYVCMCVCMYVCMYVFLWSDMAFVMYAIYIFSCLLWLCWLVCLKAILCNVSSGDVGWPFGGEVTDRIHCQGL